MVGGVLFDDERDSQDRTPGIVSVLLLGNLFKRKGVQRNTNEIRFFITPRISRPDYGAATQDGTVRCKPDGLFSVQVPCLTLRPLSSAGFLTRLKMSNRRIYWVRPFWKRF